MNKIIIEDILTNVSLKLEPNSTVTYIALNPIEERQFILPEGAKLNYIAVNFESTTAKLLVELVGEGADFEGQTLTIGDKGLFSYQQEINHKAKATTSYITNLALSFGDSQIKYETIGHIFNKMNKSNCRQLAKGIIISENSSIEAKPILLIDENDVYAYHGAAIGKMNDDELFYLMSRGLTQEEALALLVSSMINPLVEALPTEVKPTIKSEIEKRIKL